MLVHDPDKSAIAKLAFEIGTSSIVASNLTTISQQDVVFLAVHPPVIPQVLSELSGRLRDDSVLVSLAPKISIEQLRAMLEGFNQIARVIPNAASWMRQGYNPVSFCDSISPANRQRIEDVLAPLGQAPEVVESNLEAYAILTAMGPTYFWPQWSELVRIGESFGLTTDQARSAVRDMLKGAVSTLFESGLSPEDVCDLIPVKPLQELEPLLRETYQEKLNAVMEKIRPLAS